MKKILTAISLGFTVDIIYSLFSLIPLLGLLPILFLSYQVEGPILNMFPGSTDNMTIMFLFDYLNYNLVFAIFVFFAAWFYLTRQGVARTLKSCIGFGTGFVIGILIYQTFMLFFSRVGLILSLQDIFLTFRSPLALSFVIFFLLACYGPGMFLLLFLKKNPTS